MARVICPECQEAVPGEPGDLIKEGFSARRWTVKPHPDKRLSRAAATIAIEEICRGSGKTV